MSKTIRHIPQPRNNVAYGMIMAGTGKGRIMRDRRLRRDKDARRKREALEDHGE